LPCAFTNHQNINLEFVMPADGNERGAALFYPFNDPKIAHGTIAKRP
jgi:hypothetical protein